MPTQKTAIRISPEVLAEQWYGFMHGLIGQMQGAYRVAQSNGVNQKIMAERIGAKPAFVSRCLSGQQNMTVRTIHNLARAMDCRLEVAFRPLGTLTASNWAPPVTEFKGTTLAAVNLGTDKSSAGITPSAGSSITVRSATHVG
jgi:hypothetical protein